MTPVLHAANSLDSKCFSPLFGPCGTGSVSASPDGSNDFGLCSSGVLLDQLRLGRDVRNKLLQQIKHYFGSGGSPDFDLWPVSVQKRWKRLNRPKTSDELGVLSWNVNGRLDLRGCRESLLRRWSLGGFVDVGLIQEHFKKDGGNLFDIFGAGWWNLSSGAVGDSRGSFGNSRGRRSGGCAIFGQPGLVSRKGFGHSGGRLCGALSSGGLLLSIYFPTKGNKQSGVNYRDMFSKFVNELMGIIDNFISLHNPLWIVCGTDLNAHFAGTSRPPRSNDDFPAKEIRRFMERFSLVSLALELCPDRSTYLNSRGNMSCLDSFLVSQDLYHCGRVTMYEVVDFMEHGSDHSPVYIRIKVYPEWKTKLRPKRRRILKSSGISGLRKKLSAGHGSRQKIVEKVLLTFSDIDWSKAVTRKDMNVLWTEWVERYDSLTEDLIGTRWARDSSWGRKFDPLVRDLCKKASVARSWFIKAKRDGRDCKVFLARWRKSRIEYVEAWERSNTAWYTQIVTHAISSGSVAVWRLLSGRRNDSSRSLIDEGGSIVTDRSAIVGELLKHHMSNVEENSSVSPGKFLPVIWDAPFSEADNILKISNELVADCVGDLKNSSVPDNISPVVIKLLFGASDLVVPLGEMIRAIARTRVFPDSGKIAKQIFCWKGVGVRNKLENCRTITMANVLLKLAESCMKKSGLAYWRLAGFPRSYWGHFFGAQESLYIWSSTVEKYVRLGKAPQTALTDVSRAFDRLNVELYKRKLLDFGIPRQLIELIVEFISGMRVSLGWGAARTHLLDRGDTGVPQGSLEGMWNFGVYSDNINGAIMECGDGVLVGGEKVHAVIYADDISPVNPGSVDTNLALESIAREGLFNGYKFKHSKCKIVGAGQGDNTVFKLGERRIEKVKFGLLLGMVIDGKSINAEEHVSRRAKMVDAAISQIKSWRTRGLPYLIVYRNLFKAKLLPRFAYGFALLHFEKWGKAHDQIRKTLGKALCAAFGWRIPKGTKIELGIWFPICGFPPVKAYLRQLKLEMATRLKVADNKAGRIFRGLFSSDRGSFESDVRKSLQEWLLIRLWSDLSDTTVTECKRKIRRIAKKCWPEGLQTAGTFRWLYHNHQAYSGNVPLWADWNWPKSEDESKFKLHFYNLLVGLNPAGGDEAQCRHLLCRNNKLGSVYNHHFFDCNCYLKNRALFRHTVRKLYTESQTDGLPYIPLGVIDSILLKPCKMWVGMIDVTLFDNGLNLSSIHELHRIVVIASIMSWGRFYSI